jgi:RNA polymerase sigma-70 factor (ECF subfamily)
MEEKRIISELQQKIALYEDMQAYRRLYELLNERLFWFVYSLVKSREVAEEIVSDVFIKLWNMRNALLSVDNLQVFLYVIAKNFSLNYLTKEYKYPRISLDEIQVESISTVNPEELYISSETAARIREAIEKLPAQCRLIFKMVREDGLKHKEVAAILDISELTVRNQLVIAVKKISEAIQAHLPHSSLKPRHRFS